MSHQAPSETTNVAHDPTATTPTLPSLGSRLVALTIAAIGIVYGDIGTSPLYTMKTIFSGEHAVHLDEANLLGVVSLIFGSSPI